MVSIMIFNISTTFPSLEESWRVIKGKALRPFPESSGSSKKRKINSASLFLLLDFFLQVIS